MAQEKELQASIETTGEAAAEDKDVLTEAAPDVAGEEPAGDDAAPEDVAADDAADDAEDEEYEDTEDSLTYSNGVIEKIVAMATREVPHVLGMKGNLIHFVQETLGAKDLTKGVTVEVTDDNRVIVNISVIIEYGCYAPAIFEDVKERVTERLAAMTGLEVAGINLRIEDVVTLEAYNASKKQAEAARENAA
ncbi:Asp23/Gls24 family envelope stress response protein [Collinsella intestinalis]|uniref:Asp23/Gls24 family envelope stress response protein n=1 Tax=Collinsella intestinalis TaxID=147207 RepID=UPI00195CF6E8|nr:Asp23/Gls24 family envelope stress response protein [Collinsella intestinalis]MBM6907505.1 Asp23/Gls24 family envelope stress response protein [Collinsella intestinalis]MDM8163556.1 Asp23/Gls24 family envelope stress response protein [Collinsella intestinalis]